MRPAVIHKSPADLRVAPNLADYEGERRRFSWTAARRELAGTRDAAFNIGVVAVDRHLATAVRDQGVDLVQGIIYPPQVALVGFGKVTERAWVENGALVAAPVITASLSADHRVSDGHGGAALLAEIARLLREPERL